MPRIYVGIGSNIEPAANLSAAVLALGARYKLLQISPVYRSKAVGMVGADFLNMAACADTTDSATTIANYLRMVENDQGRDRTKPKFSSRTLDLDLLMYGDVIVDGNGLRLPHPDITDYAFVLKPLADIAGETNHPALGVTISVLLEQMMKQSANKVEALQLEPLELRASC